MTTTRQHLDAVHNQITAELQRGDSKATTLLSLVGITAACLVALASQPLTLGARVLVWAALVPIGTSVLLLLSVVRPRLNDDPPIGSWLWAARVGPATLIKTLDHIDGPTAETAAAVHVCELARLARQKFTTIRNAITFLVLGVLLAATGLAAWAVTA